MARRRARGDARSRAGGLRLHRHPPHRSGRNHHRRANAGILHRSSVQRAHRAARLCAHRNDAGRQGRAEMDVEIRQRRRQWRRPAVHLRRLQREGPLRRAVLLPDLGRLHALRRRRRGQNYRAMGAWLLHPRKFRQRRGGQGPHQRHHRPCRRFRAMGLRAGGSFQGAGRLGRQHRDRIYRRQAQCL